MSNNTKALVPLPPDYLDIKDKHSKVTDRQAQLVAHLLQTGENTSDSAKAIGANRDWAYQTLRKQHVRAFARECAEAAMGGEALSALYTMGDLLSSKSQAVRREAASDLLDRYGLGKENQGVAAPSVNVVIRID